MHMNIESTNIITNIDGVPCRVWRGHTPAGRPIELYIHRIRGLHPGGEAELAEALSEQPRPMELRELEAIGLRHIL